jgi:hypothetical protein
MRPYIMKLDKDCYVHPLGISDIYACRSKNIPRNKCPYLMYCGLDDNFCTNPDRHNIPELTGIKPIKYSES